MVKLGPYELNQIYTGDARELSEAIPDESVDLIFTDPPYSGRYLCLYKWLAGVTPRILKPDGFLLVYVAPYHKDTIMSYCRETLEYFWDYIEYNTQSSTIIWPKNTISRYKSIIAYRLNGSKATPRPNVLGVLPSDGGDKRFHKWGQSEYTARYFIDYFSEVGDIVFDPFIGAGTTSAVCKSNSRHYVGFEINPATADLANVRGAQVKPPLPQEWQPQQAALFDVAE